MKKWTSKTISILILSVIVTSAYADPPLPTPVGRVVWAKGVFKAIMPNKEERILQKLSLIYLKDTLITDDHSEAQIVFTDDTLMTFRSGTKFVIDNYSYNPQATKSSVGKFVMNLIEGGFRTITGMIEKKNPNDYTINTPVATIGARGTEYAVYIKNGELNIGYYDGTPCVKSKDVEVCLNKESPYARVPNSQAPPQVLQTRPQALDVKLEIKPAKLQPFVAPEGVGSNDSNKMEGTVSSFCISS